MGSYLAIVAELNLSDRFPLGLDAHWYPATGLSQAQASAAMCDWLMDETSLTARLKRHCQDFSVRVLGEGYQPLSLDEQRALATVESQGFVREVFLLCDQRPWVFARTIVPLATLAQGEQLRQLGDQPLGALLFATPGMCRGDVEVTYLPAEHRLCHVARMLAASASPIGLWGRRSCFSVPAGSLLVNEIFLPDCVAYVGS